MSTLHALALLAGTVTTGLSAGMLTGFATAVMPGLQESDDETFIDAFVGIDQRVGNPVFGAYVGGGLVLPIVALALGLGDVPREQTTWTAAGAGLYLAAMAITGAVHLPLNREVGTEGRRPGPAAASRLRRAFERRWVRWNRVRAVMAAGSTCCLAWALHLGGAG